MTFLYKLYSLITGHNAVSTPPSVIAQQLNEKRALPTGVTEFHAWADRIISGAMLTADPDSQKFALCTTLLNLPPTTAFETDLYFIHVLRKHAVNQVADALRGRIRDEAKARLEKQNQGEATPLSGENGKVLAVESVPTTK